MSRENRAGRDQRPPAARFAEIEAALDKRVLDALAAAWGMAKDRQLIAGHYITRAGVAALAAELAEPINGGQAAEVIEALNAFDRHDSGPGVALEEEALDKIWDVIA